jgi:hypothetical protein
MNSFTEQNSKTVIELTSPCLSEERKWDSSVDIAFGYGCTTEESGFLFLEEKHMFPTVSKPAMDLT